MTVAAPLPRQRAPLFPDDRDASRLATKLAPLPASEYRAMIVDSATRDTKHHDGKYLELRWRILDGAYEGRTLVDRINVWNRSEVSEEIGQRRLAALCAAAGVLKLTKAEQLHGIPCTIGVVVKQSGTYGPSNQVKSYRPAGAPVPPLAAPHRTPAPPVSAPRFKLLSDVELEQLPPIQFLVGGMLPTSGLGVLYGAPSAGKSFLALDLGCHIAAGVSWLGRETQQGRVVYLAPEGSAGLRQRLAAWKMHQGLTSTSIPIYFLPDTANLLERGDVSALKDAIDVAGDPPSLIIVDTLHRSMPGGEENSSRDVGLVIEHADRLGKAFGAFVLFIHHVSKGTELERGSSVIRGNVDAMMFAKHEPGRRELRCEKAKDWAPFDPIQFELVPVGESCVIEVPTDLADFVTGSNTAEHRCLTVLGTSFLEDGASFSAWLEAVEMPKTSFYRVRTQLVRTGYVAQTKRGRSMYYTLTEKGHRAIGSTFQTGSTEVPEELEPIGSTGSTPL